MYSESKFYVGDEKTTRDFYHWCIAFNARRPGIMQITRLALVEDEEVHTYMQRQYSKERSFLLEAGLTYGVVVTFLVEQDDTDDIMDGVWEHGVHRLIKSKDSDEPLEGDYVLDLENHKVFIKSMPYRLCMWKTASR